MRWHSKLVAAIFLILSQTPQAQSQLSSQDANFTGSIPASCSIDVPYDSYAMTYDSTYNKFYRTATFELTSNGNIQLQLGKVDVVQEPSGIPGRTAYARLRYPESPGSNTSILPSPWHASSASPDTAGEAIAANNTPGVATEYSLVFNLETSQSDQNSRRYLLPGDYIYRVTINCLQ